MLYKLLLIRDDSNETKDFGAYVSMVLPCFPEKPEEFIEKVNHYMKYEMNFMHKINRVKPKDGEELYIIEYEDFNPETRDNAYICCRGMVKWLEFDMIGEYRIQTETEQHKADIYHLGADLVPVIKEGK